MDCNAKNITGSVQIKNGYYYLSINYYVDGKRKPKMINTRMEVKGYNKRRAEDMLRQHLAGINQEMGEPQSIFPIEKMAPTKQQAVMTGRVYPGDSVSASQYFERWIGRMKKAVRVNTWNQYNMIVTKRIIPYFSELGLMMSEIEPHHIQSFFDYCSTAKRLDGKPGEISSSSLRRIHANLSKAFRDAVRLQEIPANPVAGVEPPQNNVYHAKYYTADQLKILLDAIKGCEVEMPIMLCAYYGLRRSEALGLKWDAIDFKAGTVTIQHTVTVSKGQLIKEDITKNKSSYRTLPLLPEVQKQLEIEKRRQDKNRELFGAWYNADGYICVEADGNLILPSKVSRHYKSICKAAELPVTRLHDIRHTNASILVKNSCNMKEVQRWLGHSDIKTTGNRYSHLETNDLMNVSSTISQSGSVPGSV